jgi:predicted porin
MKRKILLLLFTIYSFNLSAQEAEDDIAEDIDISGFLNLYGIFAGGQDDMDDHDYNEFDVIGDGEIRFSLEKEMKHGIAGGFVFEVESEFKSANDVTDEVFGYLQHKDYGRLELGLTKSIAEKVHLSAPFVGNIYLDESFAFAFLDDMDIKYMDETYLNSDQEANKVSYITPKWKGLQVSLGYIPGNGDREADGLSHEDYSLERDDTFKYGVVSSITYSNKFGDWDVSLSLAGVYYKDVHFDLDEENVGGQNEASLGFNLGYNAFVLGGAFKIVETEYDRGADYAMIAMDEGSSYSFGLSYEFGPLMASLSYLGSLVDSDDEEDKMDMYSLSLRYSLSKYAYLASSAGRVELDDEEEGGISNQANFLTIGVTFTF